MDLLFSLHACPECARPRSRRSRPVRYALADCAAKHGGPAAEGDPARDTPAVLGSYVTISSLVYGVPAGIGD